MDAISQLDVSRYWGKGETSSSDAQRFAYRRKLLQQTYSHKFRDFALEFYTFLADNFAPFYSLPKEFTDRDAPYALDGILYNESDLPLHEHYVTEAIATGSIPTVPHGCSTFRNTSAAVN